MAFEQYHIEDLAKQTTSLIKKTTSLADFTQKILFGYADALESQSDLAHFNRFIRELSTVTKDANGKEKVMLSSTARQVGTYMQAHLPIAWKNGEFVLEDRADFDWAEARDAMEKVRWDQFKQLAADDAFNAESAWKSAMNQLKKIVAHAGSLPDDQKHYARQAEQVLKANGMA